MSHISKKLATSVILLGLGAVSILSLGCGSSSGGGSSKNEPQPIISRSFCNKIKDRLEDEIGGFGMVLDFESVTANETIVKIRATNSYVVKRLDYLKDYAYKAAAAAKEFLYNQGIEDAIIEVSFTEEDGTEYGSVFLTPDGQRYFARYSDVETMRARFAPTPKEQVTTPEQSTHAPPPSTPETEEEPIDLSYMAKISASSTLPPSNVANYNPLNVADGNSATVWCENAEGDGAGETEIVFKFPKEIKFTRIGIIPGYDKGERWTQNLRLKSFGITDGSPSQYSYTCSDSRSMQYFSLEGLSGTKLVLDIRSSHSSGAKWQDLCIGEIEIWGVVVE